MQNETPARRPASVAAALGLAACVVLAWWLGRAPGPEPGVASPIRFEEVAASVGVRFRHVPTTLDPRLDNVAPHVSGVGAAVAVTDFDGDGWCDLYATSSRFGTSNGLFRNLGNGKFEDVAAAAGLADLNKPGQGVSMGSVWGDFDNDGREDVFVYRWGRQLLFRNAGAGRFEDVTKAAGLDVWMNSNGAVWLDFDQDGLIDLYVAGYFRSDVDMWHLKTTRIMQSSFEFADNGGRNRLFHNVGGGRFEDVTDEAGVGSTRWTLAVTSADFDGNGRPDLYLANDYGPEELFLNRDGRHFERATGVGLSDDSKSGMCAAVGDVRNRGFLDVFVTNISERGYLLQGNNLRLNFLDGQGCFLQMAEGVTADCGWAWGAQFADFDLDGWQDLFVANGFISADRERNYWYGMTKISTGTGKIFEDAANWPAMKDLSLSGYQRSRVLWNRGSGLVDVAERAGVTDRLDGRGVAIADLWNRGRADVIVANQGGPLLIYRNVGAAGNHALRLRLVGTRSNRSAIGAEVLVESDRGRQRQVVSGGVGFASQNDRRLLFGLGAATRAERVVIHWPSGTKQVLTRVPADQLHVVEEPAAR